jgi:hypothetical protein
MLAVARAGLARFCIIIWLTMAAGSMFAMDPPGFCDWHSSQLSVWSPICSPFSPAMAGGVRLVSRYLWWW